MKTLLFILFLTFLAICGCGQNDNPLTSSTSSQDNSLKSSSLFTVNYVINNRDSYSVQCDEFYLVDLMWIIGKDTIPSEEVTFIKPTINKNDL